MLWAAAVLVLAVVMDAVMAILVVQVVAVASVGFDGGSQWMMWWW